jgi:hypothetical protein
MTRTEQIRDYVEVLRESYPNGIPDRIMDAIIATCQRDGVLPTDVFTPAEFERLFPEYRRVRDYP